MFVAVCCIFGDNKAASVARTASVEYVMAIRERREFVYEDSGLFVGLLKFFQILSRQGYLCGTEIGMREKCPEICSTLKFFQMFY